ncbi:MAG: Fe-S protein assembly co-chaperone HscB [Magnetococcales bacterium]|nr:Fe-S protein assembly co-chaperone HscB [Magnetococcales bacterium]
MNPTPPRIHSQACWSCRGPTPAGLFCTTCNALLPPDMGANRFALFGLEPSYEPDAAILEKNHRALQKQLHPDFFAQRGPTERRLSLEWTTRLNEAWQTLTDPVARAGYLLELLGWKSTGRPALDPEFLEEVMTLREALEEVDPLAPDALPKLATLKTTARGRLKVEESQIAHWFRRAHSHEHPPSTDALGEIARLVDRMRYHRRYLEELDRLEDRAFDQDA